MKLKLKLVITSIVGEDLRLNTTVDLIPRFLGRELVLFLTICLPFSLFFSAIYVDKYYKYHKLN